MGIKNRVLANAATNDLSMEIRANNQ